MLKIIDVQKYIWDPYICFSKRIAIFRGVFSRELQELFTHGNSFAETYVGVSDIFYVCR
jgi:hypothetical protein